MMTVNPIYGTRFVSGLQSAYNELNRERMTQDRSGRRVSRKPVFILLTDSEAADRSKCIQYITEIMQSESSEDSVSLCIHALGIGSATNEPFLRSIAQIGRGSYKKIQGENDVPMETIVSDTFATLAEKPDINVGVLTIT
eukprot:TRINITY_DN104183_c0_g1_i1.p1 TRINITY_DN104183_c0_g1~~TRINITY_DN104183_c0_g1_i1.p1  ORF type:complete len:140 (-),score=8.07 TRINITY_DN104183_c0_g1_i1:118-537(-)